MSNVSKMQKRRMSPMDYVNVFWGINMQLAIEFEHPKYVNPAVEELIRVMNSFRCQANLIHVKSNNNIPTVFKIPSELKTLKECAAWINREHRPKRNSLASIACDDRRVVVTSSHICNDGVQIAKIIEHISHPNPTKEVAPIPNSFYQRYYDKIFSHPNTAINCAADPNVYRLLPIRPVDKKGRFCLPHFETPISQLMGYDKEKNHVKNITETQWIALALSKIVFQGDKDFNKFAIPTVLDLRRFLPNNEKNEAACQECIGAIPVTASPTMEMSLDELGKEMRKSFNMKVNREDYYSYHRSVFEAIFRPWKNPTPPGIALECSSVGPVRIKPPVVDAWLSLITPDENKLNQTSFLTYSIVNEATKEKRFVGQFQANSLELNELDANLYLKMLEYSMKNLDYKMTVSEALKSIEGFHRANK